MPRGRPSRTRRRKGGRPLPPPNVLRSVPPAPAASTVAAGPAPERPREREASVTRFTGRDYTYVRRELWRIAVLATAIVILIVVLSFFLP